MWRATHLGLEIPCAVKFIEGDLASLPEAQSRFEREAKAAAQLRSPHVVQILDHGVCEGTPYIAMELLEGEDLGKRLARVGRLSPRDLHFVVSQVCRALAKAHSLGIVHRDLKPDNIFLVKDDDREIVKVLDFGIAKSQSSDLSGNNTKTGALLGTPYYMSPEQAQGTKQVDFRTDLWALAVICFRALTGRLPFESEALGDLLVRIIVAPVPVPSQFGPVPLGFDEWWQKAAARDLHRRFASAKDFSDSLGLVCGVTSPGIPLEAPAGPVAAAPVAPTGGMGSPLARTVDPVVPKSSAGPLLGLAVAIMLALVVVGGGVALWRSRITTLAAAPASGAPSAQPSPAAPLASATVTVAAVPAPAVVLPPVPIVIPSPARSGEPVGLPPPALRPNAKATAPAPPQPKPPSAPARSAPGEPPKPSKPAYDVGF